MGYIYSYHYAIEHAMMLGDVQAVYIYARMLSRYACGRPIEP